MPRPLAPARLLALVCAALVAATLAVLGAAPAGAQEGPGYLRVAHLAPAVAEVDITVVPFDGAPGATTAGRAAAGAGAAPLYRSVAYGAVGPYRALPAGFYAVTMRPAGSPSTAPALISATVEVQAGSAYTLAAFSDGDKARTTVLQDDLTPAAKDKARVRLVAAAPDLKTVDVAAEGGPAVSSGVDYGTATGYAEVPAGPWRLRATPVGAAGTPAAGTVELAAGSVYTVLVLGQPGATPGLTAVLDAVGMPTAPLGGVAAGGGGTAPAPADAGLPVLPLAGGAAALAGLVLVRRRLVRA